MKAPIYILLALVSAFHFSATAQDCGCDHTITRGEVHRASNYTYEPGDVFCIEAGTYTFFRFIEFKGTEEAPLIFKNCGGQVIIDADTYSGFDFRTCEHVHFTGTGTDGIEYGVLVKKTPESTSGVSLNTRSTDFEIDHIEIQDVGFAGIVAKTDPKCDNWPDSWRGSFTMRNLDFHHNYIHDFSGHGEGFYIGYTGGYESGRTIDCADIDKNTIVGDDTELLGHLLTNVKVHHNTIVNTGWDGIQVSLTISGLRVYNNYVENAGFADREGFEKNTAPSFIQNEGIAIGGGCVGWVYNNVVVNAYGQGIQNLGLGPMHIFNNLIIRPGERGIYNDRKFARQEEAGAYYLINNTIIEAVEEGMYYNNGVYLLDTPHEYYNNVIVGSQSAYEIYSSIGESHWSDPDIHSFTGFLNKEAWQAAKMEGNYTTLNMEDVKFMHPDTNDFRISETSPLIDAGVHVGDIIAEVTWLDLNGAERDLTADIGAFEFGSEEGAIGFDEYSVGNNQLSISPNPMSYSTNPFLNIEMSTQNSVDIQLLGVASKEKIKLVNDIRLNIGENKIELPLKDLDLPSGTYVILVHGGSFGGAVKLQLP